VNPWNVWPFEPGAILGLGALAVAYACAATRVRARLLALGGPPPRLFPVGRLDRETTGVLILTNDGSLADHLMHPRHGVAKTYRARVQGEPGEAALDWLRNGIELDDGRTAPAEVHYRGSSVIDITIHEGRNRQVRRM
jgi:23S rRNA pseudouridine2605 synthase